MWFYYAASAVALFTILNLLQRVLAVKSEDERSLAILFNTIAATLAICVFFFTGSYTHFRLPTTPWAYISLLTASFFYGMFERGRFYAAKQLDASIFSTVLNVSVVVAFISALFIYSETLTLKKLIGATAIFIALFLVSYNKNKSKNSLKSILFGVIICTSLGLGWVLDKKGTQYFGPDTYSFMLWSVPLIFIYFPKVDLKMLKREFQLSSWRIVLLSLINVVGYLLQLKALSLQEATRVIPIIQTSTLFVILLGIVILKEKDDLYKKVIAGLIAVAGVYLLT
jgi:drug/metabolite transporter (DMT)-like permease